MSNLNELEGIDLMVELLNQMTAKYAGDDDLKFVLGSAADIIKAQDKKIRVFKEKLEALAAINRSLENLASFTFKVW